MPTSSLIFTKKELEDIRDILFNGGPEWLILSVIINNHGIATNADIVEAANSAGWPLSKQRLSYSSKRLLKNGVKSCRSISISYSLDDSELIEYAAILHHAKKLVAIREANKNYEMLKALQKNGVIKRREK